MELMAWDNLNRMHILAFGHVLIWLGVRPFMLDWDYRYGYSIKLLDEWR